MKLKYIDYRGITIPHLTHYKLGLSLPSGDNIIKVTESEARHLLKVRNGENPCWELIPEVKPKDELKAEDE